MTTATDNGSQVFAVTLRQCQIHLARKLLEALPAEELARIEGYIDGCAAACSDQIQADPVERAAQKLTALPDAVLAHVADILTEHAWAG